ncbi:uracil phosphoribosyltransferase [Batrachochytrium salamandrivorans]|nr:uracil phosphoribosyltransferase [Batrachochytrium salamandrivorans]
MEKPSFPNVLVELGKHSKAVTTLLTRIRDRDTKCEVFVNCSDRLCRLLVEEGVSHSALAESRVITTPTDMTFAGLELAHPLSEACVVSIMRSGDIIAEAFKQVFPAVSIGKVLIQRLEHTLDKQSQVHYVKLPPDVAQKRVVFLVDPMLATGGSAANCLQVLRDLHKVQLSRVVFLNIISCPEGLTRLAQDFPEVKIVTCAVDLRLNADKYICPGLGDYGDRYYSTH